MTVQITNSSFPDCLSELPVEQLPLIICDPPYGGIVKEDWDKMKAEGYLDIVKHCEPRLIDGGSLYLWGGIGRYKDRVFFEFLSRVEDETNMRLANLITWNKRRAYGKKDDYLFTREECAWLVKGEKPAIFNIPLLDEKRGYAGYNKDYPAKSEFKRRTNVWTDITEIFRGKNHPTEKPVRLSEIMIETHTNPGDWVADFFAGSGSAGVAAVKLNRHFFGSEREAKYVDLMRQRLGLTTQQ